MGRFVRAARILAVPLVWAAVTHGNNPEGDSPGCVPIFRAFDGNGEPLGAYSTPPLRFVFTSEKHGATHPTEDALRACEDALKAPEPGPELELLVRANPKLEAFFGARPRRWTAEGLRSLMALLRVQAAGERFEERREAVRRNGGSEDDAWNTAAALFDVPPLRDARETSSQEKQRQAVDKELARLGLEGLVADTAETPHYAKERQRLAAKLLKTVKALGIDGSVPATNSLPAPLDMLGAAERAQRAREIVGRELTPTELQAIDAAHHAETLGEKVRILQERFTDERVRRLMIERFVAGNPRLINTERPVHDQTRKINTLYSENPSARAYFDQMSDLTSTQPLRPKLDPKGKPNGLMTAEANAALEQAIPHRTENNVWVVLRGEQLWEFETTGHDGAIPIVSFRGSTPVANGEVKNLQRITDHVRTIELQRTVHAAERARTDEFLRPLLGAKPGARVPPIRWDYRYRVAPDESAFEIPATAPGAAVVQVTNAGPFEKSLKALTSSNTAKPALADAAAFINDLRTKPMFFYETGRQVGGIPEVGKARDRETGTILVPSGTPMTVMGSTVHVSEIKKGPDGPKLFTEIHVVFPEGAVPTSTDRHWTLRKLKNNDLWEVKLRESTSAANGDSSDFRMVFRFSERGQTVTLVDIGNHETVRRY